MWRPFLALGLGLILALGFDQAIPRLLVSPVSEDHHWFLQTVQYHPILGWSGYPHFAATHDGIRIQTNSLGYRDRETVEGETNDKLGVLFLGDSFTWGDEIGAEERFPSLLEASCGSLCDQLPPVRAINKGIIGYGTTQSLLDYLLARETRHFDIVILALFTGNDLTDNTVIDSPSGPRPRLIPCQRDDAPHGLCLEGVPVPPVIDWPEHRWIDPRGGTYRTFSWSGIFTVASQRRAPRFLIDRRIAAQMQDLKALPFPIIQRTSDAPIEDRIGQLTVTLRALDRTIRTEGKMFGVMVFPSAHVYIGDANELQDYRATLAALTRLNIRFVDYYEATKDRRWEDLYVSNDGHWRASGHQEAAAQLRSLLVTLLAEKRNAISSHTKTQ